MTHTLPPSPKWTPHPGLPAPAHRFSVWRSQAANDAEWDSFLLKTPLGQFQQSSAWARVKALEGWNTIRILVTLDNRIVSGFQMLWKRKFGVAFGYISKGPVAPDAEGLTPLQSLQLAKQTSRLLGLGALIVQLPDYAFEQVPSMAEAGFMQNRLIEVADATVCVDLTRPWKDIEAGFSHVVPREVRKLRERGFTTTFAGVEGARHFFSLMAETCTRQKVVPNPSSPERVRALLSEFQAAATDSPEQSAQLLFAAVGDRPLAGILLIRFGTRLSMWKKGLHHSNDKLQPAKLLEWDALLWGHARGCHKYDLVGIDRYAAEEIIKGRKAIDVPMKSSDRYKLFFGGRAETLPRSGVWFSSKVLGQIYGVMTEAARRVRGRAL